MWADMGFWKVILMIERTSCSTNDRLIFLQFRPFAKLKDEKKNLVPKEISMVKYSPYIYLDFLGT